MNKENKVKDKKIFRQWVVIMVLSFLCGGIVGVFSEPVAEILKRFVDAVRVDQTILGYGSLGIFFVINVIGIAVTYYFYRKAKRLFAKWDDEEEEQLDSIEENLDYALLPMAIISSCNYFLFAVVVYISMDMAEADKWTSVVLVLVSAGIFLGASFVNVALQKKIVDLEKEINPEKRGNIFDKDFGKEWLASCDEAQQLTVYKAGFKAYQSAVNVSTILFLVALVGMVSFDTGLLPTFCVMVLMLVMQVSYYTECRKLERSKR